MGNVCFCSFGVAVSHTAYCLYELCGHHRRVA